VGKIVFEEKKPVGPAVSLEFGEFYCAMISSI